MTRPADWTQLPLAAPGRSLVEASAGTGKTWTIAALYLRLLLEQGFMPRQIVVSTFTNAAAAELAGRLRGKLSWALAEAVQYGTHADDATEGGASDREWLRNRWREDASRRQDDTQRLQAALAEFDAAPVSTLHALCSRILADHPFAAGALFRGREMIDGKTLEAALVADLWRVISQGDESEQLVRLARDAKVPRNSKGKSERLGQGDLKKYVPELLKPDVVVMGGAPDAIRGEVEAIVGDAAVWGAELESALDLEGALHSGRGLKKAWLALSKALAAQDGSLADAIYSHREALSEAAGLKGVNKVGLGNPLILKLAGESSELVRKLSPWSLDLALNRPLRRFLIAAQHWCRQAMRSRLDTANQSTFDQLLYSVRDALEPHDGQRALADALFAEWPVALVDEFQDTDPVQFGILDAIYRDAAGAARGRLVMIGDPKQAIYRFRGGDVQAYERAKHLVAVEDRLALDTNYRSSRAYVEAINQFYRAVGETLGPKSSDTKIAYQDVEASRRQDGTPLVRADTGEEVARPLVVHMLGSDDGAGDKGDASLETKALRVCAGQITWALSVDGYAIRGDRSGEDKPLQPGDIAVLLPGHAQIAKLAALLKARGIPCVATSQNSVFETDTARDLRLVLHAALHADDPRVLRAAIATRLWGGSLARLQALRDDPAGWDREAARFHILHGALEQQGPLAVVDALLDTHARRLLETVEGERMLTDLRHLGELLQEAWVDCGGGERLAAWFAQQMDGDAEGADAADARALRLESDAKRVRLMTLHASKGLEFPVVFLPLMWKHTRPTPATQGAHLLTDDDGKAKYLVEGPAKDKVKQQEYEERYRILYVALTRAIHACHVFALTPEVKATQSRLGDVPLNDLTLANLRPGAQPEATHVDSDRKWEEYEGLKWEGDATSAADRIARPRPERPPGPLPMRHSFTTLSSSGHRHVAEEDGAAEDEAMVEALVDALPELDGPDDALATPPPEPTQAATRHPDLDTLSSVAGADFGNAVHDLFEHRTPGVPFAEATVRNALSAHGVRSRDGDLESVAAPLARRLQQVLETPLGREGGPRLFDLGQQDMRAELEFNYVLDGVSLRALRKACEANGESGLVPARDQALAGLMNGKIDLVFAHGGRFHVLDYKGNRLVSGAQDCLEDYAPAALDKKMLDTRYRLQALLYTVAVERYLRERLGTGYRRDKHLGDCWYLFIRAVGLQLADGTACGVWHHRFNDGLLDAVQSVLGEVRQEAA